MQKKLILSFWAPVKKRSDKLSMYKLTSTPIANLHFVSFENAGVCLARFSRICFNVFHSIPDHVTYSYPIKNGFADAPMSSRLQRVFFCDLNNLVI